MVREIHPHAPTRATNRDDAQAFRVWAFDTSRDGWRETARFAYLPECLDYIGYCQRQGADVVFQSPTGCRTITAVEPHYATA
jgi:hypothetical protein